MRFCVGMRRGSGVAEGERWVEPGSREGRLGQEPPWTWRTRRRCLADRRTGECAWPEGLTGSCEERMASSRPRSARRTGMRIGRRVWAFLAASTLLAAACGGNGSGAKGTQATTPPQPAKVTITASASGKQVTFDVPGSIRPGATELTLVNNLKEPAEFQLLRLDGGHTLAEFLPALERASAPIPAWVHAAGGIGQALPGRRRGV